MTHGTQHDNRIIYRDRYNIRYPSLYLIHECSYGLYIWYMDRAYNMNLVTDETMFLHVRDDKKTGRKTALFVCHLCVNSEIQHVMSHDRRSSNCNMAVEHFCRVLQGAIEHRILGTFDTG